MKRFKHSLSHYVLSTFDMGELIPVGHFEVLPGDSVRKSTSCLLRCSPLVTPVMHPVTVRIHDFFVPFRLLWNDAPGDNWEEFITGGPDGDNATTPPRVTANAAPDGSLQQYLGVPPALAGSGYEINAWPIRAYNLVFNEYYRDQDLVTAAGLDDNVIRQIAWEKDQFTAARPWSQKGPSVTLPIGTRAPVRGIGLLQGDTFSKANTTVRESTGELENYAESETTQDGSNIFHIERDPDDLTTPTPNIWADLGEAEGPDVIEFRRAMALQRYQEARAQYGSRYTEYLRYLGVRSADSRLQRPEYLGGGKATISFSEVLRTGNSFSEESEESYPPVGEMSGHGISALRTRRWIRYFQEHGIVMSFASVRPRTMYVDGLFRSWRKSTKEDYWQKELEMIGQQEVLRSEVYTTDADPGIQTVFGFNDRYYEYRHHPSYVCGDFRTTLLDWHLGRTFGAGPTLNSAFVSCDPSKRIFASQATDVLWSTFSHSIQARRMVTNSTIGRIL